jgi:formylglycine-generating enzyme required for sulfatase activity
MMTPRLWKGTAAFAIAVGGLSTAACSTPASTPANGLELIVAAEGLTAPADFDDIHLEISEQSDGGWDAVLERDYILPPTVLPAAFTLEASDASEVVLISVTAFKGGASGQPVVQRTVQVQVPSDRLADLWLVLARACEGRVVVTGAEGEPMSSCPSGESCQPDGALAGQCGSNMINATLLPTYTPGQSLDATVFPTPLAVPSEAGPSDGPASDATLPQSTEDSTTDVGPEGCPPCGIHQRCAGSGPSASCACNVDPICTAVGSACADGATVATCLQDEGGCLYASAMSTCNNGACSSGACCVNACAAGAARCTGNMAQNCVPQSNGCYVWGPATACGGKTPVCVDGTCTSEPPSCVNGGPGMSDCGPGGSGTESCCTSLAVDGGTFYRTYANTDAGLQGEADPATVSSFRLDKYLATVGRFRQFVAWWSSGGATADGSGKHAYLNDGQGLANSAAPGSFETGWDATNWNALLSPTNANLSSCGNVSPWTSSPGGSERLPIDCLTWYEAYAFCIWDGGFLPSETEWEYAAAGGSEQREYPWGSTPPGASSQYAVYGCNNCAAFPPVGSAPNGAGLWGQLDLAGEVFEWSLDWLATYVSPCSDCSYLIAPTGPTPYRIIRGGAFDYVIADLVPTYRGFDDPSARSYAVGLRCARKP